MNQNLFGFAVRPSRRRRGIRRVRARGRGHRRPGLRRLRRLFFWLASGHYDGDLRMIAAATYGPADNKCAPSASAALSPHGSTR